MKNCLFTFGLLLAMTFVSAQKISPVIQWQKSLGGSKVDRAYTIIRTLDKGYLVVGESYSNDGDVTGHHGSTDSSDAWVVKLDTAGRIQWQQSYGGSRNDRFKDILQAENGDFICVGSSESDNGDLSGLHSYLNGTTYTANSDLWIMRISSTGVIKWSKLLGGTDVDAAQVIRKATDGGGYVVAGNSSSADGDVTGNHGVSDIWLLKINDNGLLQWQQSYGNIENQFTSDLIVTSDGNYVISGYSTTSHRDGAPPCIVIYSAYTSVQIKVTALGNSIWTNIPLLPCGVPGQTDYCYNLIEMPLGRLCYVGNTYFTAAPQLPAWKLNKLDAGTGIIVDGAGISSSDQRVAIKSAGAPAILGPHVSKLLPDSNIISCVSINYPSSNDYDAALTLINSNFLLRNIDSILPYRQKYGGTNTDVFAGLDIINEQEYIAAGFSNSNNGNVSGNHGDYDCWVVKFSSLNTIKGKAFIDKNGNGIKEAGEPYANNYYVESKKNGFVMGSTTDMNGSFVNYVDTGSFTTTLKLPKPYYTISPSAKQSVFIALNKVDSFDFALIPVPGINDLEANMQGLDVLRPGFKSRYRINYANRGTASVSNTFLRFIKPSKTNYVSASPIPSQVSGDTIIWNIGNLAALDSSFIILTLQAQPLPGVDIGDRLSFAVDINPVSGDQVPNDNRDTIWQTARGSFDPNDKVENYDGVIYSNQLSNFKSLNYTIRFQNTGTDTAFSIVVRDTLSSKLDPTSLQIVAASHPFTFTLKNNKYCTWTFDNIHLVDSNTNEPLSHGYISYQIKPFTPMSLGDTVNNRASVYFDFNPAVKTNNQITSVKQSLLPPPTPVVNGLFTSYCGASGIQKAKIVNLPAAGNGTTVTVKLDAIILPVSLDSTFNFDVAAISAGVHMLSVSFVNSSGADTLRQNITITAAVTPNVDVSVNLLNIVNLTDPVTVTATNVSGGGATPLYTFASDRIFLHIVEAESSSNQYSVNTSTLPMGDNWVYVKMKTSDTCFTAQTNIDSIKLYKLLVPDQPVVSGTGGDYCGSGSEQKFKINNVPAANYMAIVTAKLDGSIILSVSADSSFSIVPSSIAAGNHSVVIAFTNASGSKTDTMNFSVIAATTPNVNLSANITTVTNLTDPILITATNASGGGTSPKYTFAKDRSFANILQAESSSNTLSIQPNTLIVGANWIYVRMKTSDSCFSAQTNVDSIKIERSAVTGLTDIDFPNQLIKVYPNPFAGIINISGLNTGKTYTIVISNAKGQEVYNRQFVNTSKAFINKEGLQTGKYWLSLYDYKKHALIGTVSLMKQ